MRRGTEKTTRLGHYNAARHYRKAEPTESLSNYLQSATTSAHPSAATDTELSRELRAAHLPAALCADDRDTRARESHTCARLRLFP